MDIFPKRMFFALPVPADGFAPTGSELEKYGSCLKIVPPENFHITLKFLGETDLALYENLLTAMDSTPLPRKTECRFRGIGCFPGIADPKIIWAGTVYSGNSMDEIFRFVEMSCISAGFPPEKRKFVPHLTLARVKREAKIPGALKDFIKKNRETVYSDYIFDSVVLYESILKKNGPEYREVKKWGLA